MRDKSSFHIVWPEGAEAMSEAILAGRHHEYAAVGHAGRGIDDRRRIVQVVQVPGQALRHAEPAFDLEQHRSSEAVEPTSVVIGKRAMTLPASEVTDIAQARAAHPIYDTEDGGLQSGSLTSS